MKQNNLICCELKTMTTKCLEKLTNKIKLYHVYISKFYGKNSSKRSLEVLTFALKLMIA